MLLFCQLLQTASNLLYCFHKTDTSLIFRVEKCVLVPHFKTWRDHRHHTAVIHHKRNVCRSVFMPTFIINICCRLRMENKQIVLCLSDIVRKPFLSARVNIKAVSVEEAWWDICLLSPVFTASVSIKLSMSWSCYCLWRFFFPVSSIGDPFSASFH